MQWVDGSPRIDTLTQKLKTLPKQSTERVDLLNLIGYKYWIVDAEQSISYGTKALQLATQLRYKNGQARANRVIGVAHWAQGNLTNALQFLSTSYNQYENIADKTGMANTWLNIGMVYADLKQYPKAMQHYKKAINAFTELDLKGRIATTFTKLGTLLLEQNKPEEAKEYLVNALNMHTEANFTYGIAEAHNRLGILYVKKEEFEQAAYHIKQSIALGSTVNDYNGLTNNLILQGKVLRYSGEPEEALEKLEKGLQLAQKYKLKTFELLAYEELKELKKQQNKTEESFYYYDKYSNLKDSLFNSEKLQQVAYIAFENELQRKDNELQVLKAQEKKDMLIKLILIISVCLLSLCGFFIYRIYIQRAQKTKQLAQKELENARLKEKELQQQLDFKNKELTSYTLNFIQKNQIVEQLQTLLAQLKKDNGFTKNTLITDLKKIIRSNLSIDKDWEDFNRYFEDAHQGFYTKLKAKHENLSANDLKICSLIRLNMNIKETAAILGISPESVKTARYRLRKKLQLSPDQEILNYLLQLEQDTGSTT